MIIIGEKINGTIPAVAKAIEGRDDAFIRNLAIRQAEAGADYLDVCAGTVSDLEYDALIWLIDIVQDAVETPVCIDSPDVEMITRVLPVINKVGLINSVSGEKDKCEKLFPVVADTDWSIIALTCDDHGIPQSVEKKVEIAGIMIEKAKSCGIVESRLFIDPLVLTLATASDALVSFTGAMKKIRDRYPEVKFTSGLSNISFGMPNRKLINRSFLAYSIDAGMDSAIMDPTNKDLYSTILASEALLGRDRHCRNYIKAHRKGRLS